MKKIIRKGVSVFFCVVMLLVTGCTPEQMRNLNIGDASRLQIIKK
ncbi:hypothetical protein [Butyrivibrio sp. AE2015]|nr:hypothetical protein [Butyrivibrio sp. AE2015]